MDHLKSLCEHWLCSHLTVQSVASTLLFADMHNAAKLKSSCIDFFINHSAEVIPTEGYQNMIKVRMELGIELLHAFSAKVTTYMKAIAADIDKVQCLLM